MRKSLNPRETANANKQFEETNHEYLIHTSDKGFKCTVVNWTSVHGGSLWIKLTVPLNRLDLNVCLETPLRGLQKFPKIQKKIFKDNPRIINDLSGIATPY